MKPFEMDSTAEATLQFAATDGLSLPYDLTIPNQFDGFVLRFIHFVDALFPDKRSLRNLTGGLCNRIWTLRGWASWLFCTTAILSLLGVAIHTLSWLLQDPARASIKPSLYLAVISLIWIIEQTFCVFLRPLIPLRSMHGYVRNWSPITCYIPKLYCAFAFLVFAGNLTYVTRHSSRIDLFKYDI